MINKPIRYAPRVIEGGAPAGIDHIGGAPGLMPSLYAAYEFQTCPLLTFDDEVPHCVPNNGVNATRFG
jgi:hypothetical protein